MLFKLLGGETDLIQPLQGWNYLSSFPWVAPTANNIQVFQTCFYVENSNIGKFNFHADFDFIRGLHPRPITLKSFRLVITWEHSDPFRLAITSKVQSF